MALTGKPASGGLFHSLRGLLGTALGIAQVRLQLFGTELEAEKLRVLAAVWRLGLALLFLNVALVLAAGFVLMLFWDGYRLAALGVMVLLCVGAGVGLLLGARAALGAGEDGPFALSLSELKRDLHGLQAAASPAGTPATPPTPQARGAETGLP